MAFLFETNLFGDRRTFVASTARLGSAQTFDQKRGGNKSAERKSLRRKRPRSLEERT